MVLKPSCHFDVIVVGGGVLGATVSLALSRSGLSVATFDEGRLSGGASAMSGGVCRVFDLDPMVVELASESREWYERALLKWPALLGGCRTIPFLYFIDERNAERASVSLNSLRDHLVVKKPLGEVQSPMSKTASSSRSWTVIEQDAFVIDVGRFVTGVSKLAQDEGAKVMECNRVERIRANAGGYEVDTIFGSYSASRVVCAAGASSHRLLSPIVSNLTCRPRGIEAFIFDTGNQGLPFSFVDGATGLYGRPLSDRSALVGKPTSDWGDVPPKDHSVMPTESMLLAMEGLFDCADWKPVGRRYACDAFGSSNLVQEPLPGLHTCIGDGGGVKIAPAIARIVTERILRSLHTRKAGKASYV